MLVGTKEMLEDAQFNHYAIGAFNVENLEFVMAVIKAAEAQNSPVIMQTTPGTLRYVDCDYFFAMVANAAHDSRVPVALHLDHGDSYERCCQALRAGYTSVMIDGSQKPFDENIALTKRVCDMASAMEVCVEAELGKVGGKEDDAPSVEGQGVYTDPEEAKTFVDATHCSSLAVGVGTAHGVYKGTPHIQQEVLKSIREVVDIPLVLHGTSGVPNEQVVEAIKNGVCKVNYATELRQVYSKGYSDYQKTNPDVFDPKKPAAQGIDRLYKLVCAHMENLGSVNRAESVFSRIINR